MCDLALKYKLVDLFGAECNPSTDSVQGKRYFVAGYTANGDKVPLNIIEDTYNTYFWFTKQCDAYYENVDYESGVISAFDNSLGKHLKADIVGYLKSKAKDNIQLKKAIFTNLLQREACISGAHSIDDCSLKDYGSYEELPGGNLVINGGFIQLVNILLGNLEASVDDQRKAGSSIAFEPFLDHKVDKIKWKTEGHDKVEIICSNGSSFTCDHLVSTLPLGVLKFQAQELFEPQLPQYKLDCIKSLGFSVVDKVFLEFRNKITPEFIDPLINEILVFWPDDETEGSSPNTDIILKDENTKVKWWTTIYSFARITDRCLMGWLSGDEAELVEKMDPKEVGKQITENVLRKILKRPDFPEPENVVVTKWKADEFARGSYTYIPSTASIKDVEMLAQPIYSDPGQEKVR